MPKPIEKKPKSFQEFVQIVDDLQSASSESLWYRGAGDASYNLTPSLFRHRKAPSKSALESLEQQLMTRFRQRSIPFLEHPVSDEWDQLFVMQHYGVPTRLLDWTENPFIALYFAITSAVVQFGGTGRPKFTTPVSIWILHPVTWNQFALSHRQYAGGVLVPNDTDLSGYSPGRDFASMNKQAVCLYGAHNSPRIVAQRGTFTIFGQDIQAMDVAFEANGYPPGCLTKVTLGKAVLPTIRDAVFAHGTTESVVFPDLDGLAREIRRSFGFEV